MVGCMGSDQEKAGIACSTDHDNFVDPWNLIDARAQRSTQRHSCSEVQGKSALDAQ
jgi:hypothetical protein